MRSNERLLLTTRDDSSWIASLACRIDDDERQQYLVRYVASSRKLI